MQKAAFSDCEKLEKWLTLPLELFRGMWYMSSVGLKLGVWPLPHSPPTPFHFPTTTTVSCI